MKVAVVGSGPTGVGAATILAERGFEVEVFDGGVKHEAATTALEELAHAARGGRYVPPPEKTTPGTPRYGDLVRRRLSTLRLRKSVLGSTFGFDGVDRTMPIKGSWLPRSLAIGGLSNVWGTACYPLVPADYADWPVDEAEMVPWVARAAELLGVSAEDDGLADVYPLYGPHEPVTGSTWQKRQEGSGLEALVHDWRKRREDLRKAGVAGGRSRLAVVRSNEARDDGCVSCGACMSGCPVGAMWASTKALNPLVGSGAVAHRSGAIVDRLEAAAAGEIVWARGADGHEVACGPYDAVVLAAGAIPSFLIARKSAPGDGEPTRILDNDVYVFPLLLKGKAHRGEQGFALSEAALAIPGDEGGRLAHLQLYRPSGPFLGPLGTVAAASPWLRRAVERLTSRLVLGFLYLHSDESREIRATMQSDSAGRASLVVSSRDKPVARHAARRTFRRLWAIRRHTGLTPLAPFRLKGDAGLSGHIGGTLPHREQPQGLETDPHGKLFRDRQVYVADASVFPAMPAQNPTLIAVANAMRIASGI